MIDDYQTNGTYGTAAIQNSINSQPNLPSKSSIVGNATTGSAWYVSGSGGATGATISPGGGIGGAISGNSITSGSIYNTIWPAVPSSASYVVGSNDILTIYSQSGKKLMSMSTDGSVEWDDSVEKTEAVNTLGTLLQLSAEQKSGISQAVRHRMRDVFFAELISIAKENGPLSSDDLTKMLEASKIVERMKGE